MSSHSPIEILQQYWGYASFRPLQEDIVQTVANGQDTLALLPTGGGKSICFQVPGLMLEGLTLVVSPLISLMKDQVERLQRLGIAATAITSDLNTYDMDRRLQAAMDGKYRFLYVSPERLKSDMFRMRLPAMPVRLLAVDEAHCISQWGHDFRPAYRDIADIRQVHPRIPIIALTASATRQVQEDIIRQLGLRKVKQFTQSFARPNLRYFVLEEARVLERIIEIARRTQGTGIVYARTRKATEELAEHLLKAGIQAAAYHGGLTSSQRHHTQSQWQEGQIRVVAATNAFGMGIDKPDVRFVLHYHLPSDLESYYQEAGRGGRDGKTALAIAFLNPADLHTLERWVSQQHPSFEEVQHVYQLIANEYHLTREAPAPEPRLLDVAGLAKKINHTPVSLYRSLHILHQEGLIDMSDDRDDYAYVQVMLSPADFWAYKQRNPGMERFLDFLLRTLGGEVYVRETRFLPYHWQEKLQIEPSQWENLIQRLTQQKVIRYQPPRAQPTIRFFIGRQLLSKELLNWPRYEFLKEESERKLQAMLAYARRQDACRSQLISSYFGEKNPAACGVCDVCIGRYKSEVGDKEYQQIEQALKARLLQGRIEYRALLREVRTGTLAQREKILRYLLDKGSVKVDEDGLLFLPK